MHEYRRRHTGKIDTPATSMSNRNVLPPPPSDNMDAWLDMDSQYGLTDMEIISQDRSDPSVQDEYSSYTTSPAIHTSVDLVNYWVVCSIALCPLSLFLICPTDGQAPVPHIV